MKVYQINYDLRKQRDYASLFEKIQAYGTYARPLESCWIIATQRKASQVRDDLASVMDVNDGLLVTRLTGEAAWRLLDSDKDGEMTKWLKTVLGGAR